MLSIASLKEARAAKAEALRGMIATAELEKRDLSDHEQQVFALGKTEIENVERDLRNAEFLAELERREQGQPIANSDLKFDTECRKFSLLKAIAHLSHMGVDAGREVEISQELQTRSGLSAQGMLAPTNIFEKRVITTAAPVGGPGSNIIATNLLAGEYIDMLKNSMLLQRMGARVLSGLVGNLAIPRKTKSSGSAWIAENSGLTASDMEQDQLTMAPKHVGVLTEVSRNMLLQSSPDVETLLRDDFASELALAVDLAGIVGGGANQPVDVLATSGIGDVPGGAAGLAPTWANICALITAISTSNAMAGSLGFVTNSKVVGKCSGVLRSAADTGSNFIVENPGAKTLAGFPLGVSNSVPSNLTKGGSGAVCSPLIYGDWSQLLIGYWSSFDLLANPYETTAYSKGNVQVRGLLTCDVGIRHKLAFAATKDILTT